MNIEFADDIIDRNTQAAIKEAIEEKLVGLEFLVCTEDSREDKVRENIRESAWAFSPGFLSDMTDLPEEVFQALQDKYEDSNKAVLALIDKTCGFDEFVEEAVSADGYGHFLSSYDGNEYEIYVEGELYFVYRQY